MNSEHKIIKICGLTEPHNIEAIANLNPDWIGLIFYKNSPRYINGNSLANWFNEKGNIQIGAVKKVGVFVNEDFEEIIAKCIVFDLAFIQLHGNENPNYIKSLKTLLADHHLNHIKIIMAFGVSASFDFKTLSEYDIFISYFLFDTKTEMKGGSGVKFPWSKLEEYAGNIPFLLSGGIGPLDYEEIKNVNHPQFAGIDLNSKFESSPGLKNVSLLQVFFNCLHEFRLNSKF
jgi:phosphoribosylanthranilate isomerase